MTPMGATLVSGNYRETISASYELSMDTVSTPNVYRGQGWIIYAIRGVGARESRLKSSIRRPQICAHCLSEPGSRKVERIG